MKSMPAQAPFRLRIVPGSPCKPSSVAMKKHSGGVAEYRSSEGKAITLPFRGPVRATIQDILGGVRSTCTYVGASKLKELPKRTTFIRVTQQINNVFGTTDESKTSAFATAAPK